MAIIARISLTDVLKDGTPAGSQIPMALAMLKDPIELLARRGNLY
jgi:hypothetical protein